MDIKHTCTADATSDVAQRLNDAVRNAEGNLGHVRINQLRSVQKKVDELKQRGLLKRQEFAAATRADFLRFAQKSG